MDWWENFQQFFYIVFGPPILAALPFFVVACVFIAVIVIVIDPD